MPKLKSKLISFTPRSFKSVSASSQDSDGSNLESEGTPYSSPLQQVPESEAPRNILFVHETSMHFDSNGKTFLEVINQPQSQFRFRYKSERENGTHGCLQGKVNTTNLTKTYPTVRLNGYNGPAIIKCQLYQHDKEVEHPHKLVTEDAEDCVLNIKVPDDNSYTVCFRGLGIIHVAKKNVPQLLYERLEKSMKKEQFKKLNKKQLRELNLDCKKTAKSINLNIVRLRFSAHNVINDKEICQPVFSEPIYNMKSAETNEPSICYSSLCSGRPEGGNDVVLLVEKVIKGKIKLNFFEENSEGVKTWETSVNLMDSNIHHQYAIVFRTPPYHNLQISEDVNVFMELQRTTDGRRSNRMPFKYVAEARYKYKKRKKLNSSISSPAYSPASSILSIGDASGKCLDTLQIPVENTLMTPQSVEAFAQDEKIVQNDQLCQMEQQNLNTLLRDLEIPNNIQRAVNGETITEYLVIPSNAELNGEIEGFGQDNLISNPMFSQTNLNAITPNPTIAASTEQSMNIINDVSNSDINQFLENDWEDYMEPWGLKLLSDSGKPGKADESKNKKEKTKETSYFKVQEGLEVKKLTKEICELKKNKPKNWEKELRMKLERLFEIRLSNGDTFLHMTLLSHVQSLQFVASTVQSANMRHLLDSVNHLQQTVLHLAVMHDMPEVVAYLVAKGCDPMCTDKDGNTVIHHAVISQTTLSTLLEAMKKKGGKYDLDKFNSEWQTPLHLAAIYGSATSTRLLLQHGAATDLPQDYHGRTALHIAVYDDQLDVLKTLLEFISKQEINCSDWKSMTPLEIVCAGDVRPNTLEIIKLLLHNGANPTCHEDGNEPSWKLAKRHPQMWALITEYYPEYKNYDDDASSSCSEDNFESADEGDSEFPANDITTKLNKISLNQQETSVTFN